MTNHLWKKLLCCFYTNRNQNSIDVNQNRYHIFQETYEYDGNSSHMLCGIINHLTKESGGNVCDNKTVIVTSSPVCGSYHPKYAVEFDNFNGSNNYKFFHSNHNDKNSWLEYDFVKRKVNPTGYSIRTRGGYDEYHPRNWVIEGSNNKSNWTILDTCTNKNCLTGLGVTHYFAIKKQKESYKFLRIRNIGINSKGSYGILLSALEFFGSLQ